MTEFLCADPDTHSRSFPAGTPAGERNGMIESDPITSDAIATVAELLAAAYRRYLAANRLETASEPVNGELDNERTKSPHAQ
jgi:hypothetical protein